MFTELAKKRYSCRSFLDKPIEKQTLSTLLEAVRIAPSAANYQPCHVIVVRDRSMLEKIQSCYTRQWIKTAPAILVFCGDHNVSWKRSLDGKDCCDIDIAIAVDHLTLAATELGLATCWVCAFDAKKCSEIFNLPSNIEPLVLIPLGYPADQPDPKRHDTLRKKLDEIIHWETF